MRLAGTPTTPITPLTLVDRVYQRLWDWITEGTLTPGDWLRIQDLARRLKVSETPIREALIRLQQSGLVETIPHVGTRVRRITRQDIEESFDLREALECYALQRAVPRLSEATLRRLKARLQRAASALGAGDMAPAVAADIDLHSALVRAAGNARISALFGNLRDQVRMFASFGNRTPEGPRRFLEMHLRIVELLLKKDVAKAAMLMGKHMRLAKEQALRGYFGPEAPAGETENDVARSTQRRPRDGNGPSRRGRAIRGGVRGE